jgi:hypothetical protein
MAIEKTTFSVVDATNKTQLAAWLQENASDYIDEVVIDGEKLYCKKGGNNVLRVAYDASGSAQYKQYFTLYNKVGSAVTILSTEPPSIAVKTSKGIFLRAFAWENTSNINLYNDFFISKTPDGNLAIAAIILCYVNNSNLNHRMCVYDFDSSPSIPVIYSGGSSNATNVYPLISVEMQETSFINIPFANANSHCSDIYQLPYNQYYGQIGKLNDGSKDYFTNGYLALAD